MPLTPYRPNAYYYRRIAREGTRKQMRQAIGELVTEREQLRAWIREQGLIPPLISLPLDKAVEIIREPLTDYQRQMVDESRTSSAFGTPPGRPDS